MKHYPPDPGMDHVLDVLNLIFTGVFALEAVFKIIALNPKNYFGDRQDFLLSLKVFIVSIARNSSKQTNQSFALSHFAPDISLCAILWEQSYFHFHLVYLLRRVLNHLTLPSQHIQWRS